MQESISSAKESFQKALDHLDQEFSGIHSGRASTALVENLIVDAYGSKQPLKTLAQITVTEATQLTIQPWDQSLIESIKTSIDNSELQLTPQDDGHLIRLNIPAMTEERRQEMAKLVHKMAENAKIAIRNTREDARKELKKMKDSKELNEDDWEQAEKDLQKVVDEFNQTVEDKKKKKEEDIMTV